MPLPTYDIDSEKSALTPTSPPKLQSSTIINLLIRQTMEKQRHEPSVIDEQADNPLRTVRSNFPNEREFNYN